MGEKSEIRRMKCRTCGEETKHVRNYSALGCGDFIMVCATLGVWMILRELFKGRFTCDQCGSKR